MGGNLLTKLWRMPEKRLSRADYSRLASEVMGKFADRFPGRKIALPRVLADKADFGDLDLMCEVYPQERKPVNWAAEFGSLYNYVPHRNGHVYSLPIDGFQCDFIMNCSEYFQHSLDYYSFEVGMSLGIIAMWLGCRFKNSGLYLKVPLSQIDPELPHHEFREILITRNPEESFALVGVDYERFKQGFANFQEYCDWFTAGYYFNSIRWLNLDPQVLDSEANSGELGHKNRTRNKKRPNWRNFIEYVAKNRSALASNTVPKPEDMQFALRTQYPHLNEELARVSEEVKLHKARRAKFNGFIVSELTGREKEKLGEFLKAFKKENFFDNAGNAASLESWLDENSNEKIKQRILELNSKLP